MERLFLRSTENVITKLFSLAVLLILLSCASRKETARAPSFPKVKQNKPNLSVFERPVLSSDLSLLSEKVKGGKYSLVFREAPLREVLITIARDRGISVVFDETVDPQTPVTMDVRNVTFDQALQLISRATGISYVLDGKILWVFKGKVLTRIFKLKTVNIERSVLVTSTVQSGGGYGTTGGAGGTFSTVTQTTNSFSIWPDVGCNVCAILGLDCSLSGGGTAQGASSMVKICSSGNKFVAINRTTGHLVVSATEGELQEVERYLSVTEASLSKQVVLDVKIVEVTLSDEFSLGVDWNKVFDNVFRSNINYTVTFSQSSTAGGNLLPIPGFTTFAISPAGPTGNPFELIINVLKKYGKVQVISSPRLAVVNNQAAVIKVGTDMQFVTDVNTETSVETGATVVGCDVDTETYFVGVSLTLTPYIDEGGEVTLFIHPNVTELRDIRRFRSECGDVPIEEPEFSVRELDTVVKVKDGDTLVIGGLIQSSTSKTRYETPVLSKIPALGGLFTRKENKTARTELVILITPHVIYSPSRSSPYFKVEGNFDVLGR